MANPAFVQQNQNKAAASASSIGATFSSNTTTGNSIIAIYSTSETVTGSGVITGVSDGTNTYKYIFSYSGFAASYIEVWLANQITGATTPTVMASIAGTAAPNIQILEVSGLDPTQPVDYVGTISKLGTTGSTIYSLTTNEFKAPNEIIVAFAIDGTTTNSWTAQGSLTNTQSQANTVGSMMNASQIISAQTALSLSLTNAANAGGAMAVVSFANVTVPANYQKVQTNNFLFFKAPDPTGNAVMSVTEKIR